MPDADAWQSFAGLVGILVLLGAGAVALRRLGIVGGKSAPAKPAADTAAPAPALSREEVAEIAAEAADRAVTKLRLDVAETYVRREDYITNESRVIGILEAHSVMLARLDERVRARE